MLCLLTYHANKRLQVYKHSLMFNAFNETDDSEEYQTWASAFPEDMGARFNVCLSTFTDLKHIYWLPLVASRWRGPISVSLYVTTFEEFEVARTMALAFARERELYGNVIFHLTHPSAMNVVSNVQFSCLTSH